MRWSTICCPGCGRGIPAAHERCPQCGKALTHHGGRPGPPKVPPPPPPAPAKRRGWWAVVLFGVLALGFLSLLLPDGPKLRAGSEAVVSREAGAWLATDDRAYDQMIDAQNAGSKPLLRDLTEQGRAFYEPTGSRVLVVETGAFSVFVKVTEGSNPGARGWVQKELLEPR